MFGLDFKLVRKNVKFLKWVINDYRQFKKELKGGPDFQFGELWPILNEKLLPAVICQVIISTRIYM